MYHVKHVYAHAHERFTAWMTLGNPATLTGAALKAYKAVWLVLTHDSLTHEVGLNFNEIKGAIEDNQTLEAFLIANGEAVLPTQTLVPRIKTGTLIYEDAYRAGFTVDVANKETSQYHNEYTDNYWLTLSKPGVTPLAFYEHFLVTINGYLHLTDYDIDQAYVAGAVSSSLIADRAEVGLYSFEQIGKLAFEPITLDNVVVNEDYPLYERTVIKTQKDLTRYTPAISLGGYLHVLDTNVFKSVGKGLLQVDWRHIPLVKRYFESLKYIDLTTLPLDTSTVNTDLINLAQLSSNDVLLAYLTLPQSFLIFIDNDNLIKQNHAIEWGPTWDRYYGYTRHRMPMLSDTGKLLEYWKIHETGVDSYFTPNASKLDYLYNHSHPDDLTNIDSTLVGAWPGGPQSKGHAAFIQLNSSNLVFE